MGKCLEGGGGVMREALIYIKNIKKQKQIHRVGGGGGGEFFNSLIQHWRHALFH